MFEGKGTSVVEWARRSGGKAVERVLVFPGRGGGVLRLHSSSRLLPSLRRRRWSQKSNIECVLNIVGDSTMTQLLIFPWKWELGINFGLRVGRAVVTTVSCIISWAQAGAASR